MNQEYEILKNELISCREKHYSNKYSLIALISTLLTISFFVYEHLENSYLQGDKYAQRINVYIVIVEILAFVVPLVVLLCCSIKEHRNYRKMILISLYIQVVYEYPSLKREDKMFFESTISILDLEKGKTEKLYERVFSFLNEKLINSELYLTTLFVTLFQEIWLIIKLYQIWIEIEYFEISFFFCLLILLIPSLPIGIIQFLILHNSSVKKIKEKYANVYLDKIVDLAIQRGIISKAEREKCISHIIC